MSESDTQSSEQARVYFGHCETFRLRKSRKDRTCDYSRDTSWFRLCRTIRPGDDYVHVTAYPGHDYVQTKVPTSGACCVVCAEGYAGMDDLVHQRPGATT